ncbi:glycosyltransferase [Belnapia moabensis]|uniref:glycosyltransferase n=1 Tax=Belnapia moabensis TaxID=365533 RepID=UPI000A00437E|nr:glycosyltransferase [Belnapia moabensis]
MSNATRHPSTYGTLRHPNPHPRQTGEAGAGQPWRRPIRLLTFSTLFPNTAQPHHGVFVENRLRHLVATGAVESTVLAPVPWFPGRTPPRSALQAIESRSGLKVHHPRFIAPPGIGMYTNPLSLWAAARAAIRRLHAAGQEFDAIDAHYVYPDGVVAVWLGAEFRKPVVVTARGSDVSLLPRYVLPRRLIAGAIAGADALVAVSAALAEGLIALGAPREKVTVLRNGVDLAMFRPPADRAVLRAEFGVRGPMLLSVGLLIERKGHHLIIEALRDMPGHDLLIVGEGPDRAALEACAREHGVTDRVRLLGAVRHEDLRRVYAAADALVLASSREGWANVLLEAMACGTPVVAAPAWGSREAVRAPEAGIVVEERSAAALVDGIRRLLAAPPDRPATRAYAEQFGWEETTRGQIDLFRRVTGCDERPFPAGGGSGAF